jgi:predicted phage tail protein
MMRAVHLHGSLAAAFGTAPFRLDVASLAEAVRALCALRPGLRAVLRQGAYQVVAARNRVGVGGPTGQDRLELGREDIGLGLGRYGELHIVPVIEGAGGRPGMGKIILGVALITAAVFFAPVAVPGIAASGMGAATAVGLTYGNFAMMGVSLVLAGVSQMLAPRLQSRGPKSRDGSQSFIFNGPVNVTEQGHPVPVVIGRFRVGSVVASAGILTENIGVTTEGGGGNALTRAVP